MIRLCHRCGMAIDDHKDQKIIKFGEEYRVLCPDCFDLTLEFCTPAYIPGISKTQYELLVHKAKGLESIKDVYERFKYEIRAARLTKTIPEIASEVGVSNRIIMEVLR